MHEKNIQTSCIICQFNNSPTYSPAFLAYHLRIVDHVFLIDHNSSKDYRCLSCDRVTVFRSTISTYRLDINTNALLNVINSENKFDWIFVLDIDVKNTALCRVSATKNFRSISQPSPHPEIL